MNATDAVVREFMRLIEERLKEVSWISPPEVAQLWRRASGG
jgi:hypothetical protein